jgi:predicted TIM-barrel fold metal-dependent hydrolase
MRVEVKAMAEIDAWRAQIERHIIDAHLAELEAQLVQGVIAELRALEADTLVAPGFEAAIQQLRRRAFTRRLRPSG